MLNFVKPLLPYWKASYKTENKFLKQTIPEHPIKVLFKMGQQFQRKRRNCKFSYVKLYRAMAAILDGILQNQTQFLKRTIQGTFHQSLEQEICGNRIKVWFFQCYNKFCIVQYLTYIYISINVSNINQFLSKTSELLSENKTLT